MCITCFRTHNRLVFFFFLSFHFTSITELFIFHFYIYFSPIYLLAIHVLCTHTTNWNVIHQLPDFVWHFVSIVCESAFGQFSFSVSNSILFIMPKVTFAQHNQMKINFPLLGLCDFSYWISHFTQWYNIQRVNYYTTINRAHILLLCAHSGQLADMKMLHKHIVANGYWNIWVAGVHWNFYSNVNDIRLFA